MAIVPSLFNINEPVIFGLPIFLNPILVIPFMLAPSANILLGWLCTSLGLVNHSFLFLTSTTPTVLGAVHLDAGLALLPVSHRDVRHRLGDLLSVLQNL